VGVYAEHLLPRVIDKVMDTKHSRSIRSRVCAGLSGEVLELGSGSGHNLAHVPAGVTRLWTVEPSSTSRRLAEPRVKTSQIPVASGGTDGRYLTMDDGSVDTVLSTWTLCTIPDPLVALAEVRRVLTDGGRFHFVEHGCSPDARVARWQHRLSPVQRRLAGGCNLDRPIASLITDAGLRIEQLDTYYADGEPKPWSYTFEGLARPD